MTEQTLRLNQIQVDPSLQPRVGGLDESHIKELQECPDNWPPLVVVKQSGGYLLVDGFHRLAAAQNLELETACLSARQVPVQVIEIPSDGDLNALSFELNSKHGKPLSLTDRRAEAERLLRRNPQTSNMEVSRRTGLSPSTITSIREALEQESDIEPTPVRSGVGGRSYTASQSYQRQPGELPKPSVVDTFTDTMGKVFTPKDRANQRRIAHYLKRLSVALQEQDDLEGWKSAKDAADACVALFGRERTNELRETLGYTARNVLDVAIELGYEDE